MARIFHTVIVADWSAANAPTPRRPSRDAIWIAVARAGRAAAPPVCHRTRAAALAALADLFAAEAAAGRRVLAGFDFPFGWPRGLAARVTGRPEGPALWDWLADAVTDGPDNRSNRFAAAERINALFPGLGPFWGRPRTAPHPGVPERGRDRHGPDHPPERRHAEALIPRAQPCWKLYTTGSVGSQALVGVAGLARLRRDPRLAGRTAVWPFDGGFAVPDAAVTLAEIYPGLIDPAVRARVAATGGIKDAVQVTLLAEALRRLDAQGRLAEALAAPRARGGARSDAAREEAWILGLDLRAELLAAAEA